MLLEPTSSPLVAALLARIRNRYPDVCIHFHALLANGAAVAGTRTVLGAPLIPHYDFSRADVVLSLDADFLAAMPFSLRYARDFADRRRITTPSAGMNRLYAVGAMLTPTAGIADHRLRVQTGDVEQVLAEILAAVVLTAPAISVPADVAAALGRFQSDTSRRAWVDAVAHDLRASQGRSIAIAGERQSPAVHALTAALGNVGTTVSYTPSPILEAGEASHELRRLVDAMRGGAVDTLIIAKSNPAYTAPVDLEFARWLHNLPRDAYLGLYENETARQCTWFLPAAHYLEAWGDARAYDGTLSIIQPLIAPLYDGKTVSELLALFAGGASQNAYTLLRDSWMPRAPVVSFEAHWEGTLQHGFATGTALPRTTPAFRWSTLPSVLAHRAPALEGIEITFAQSPSVYDGRFANNGWLQELPAPLTKLTWDNAAILSPATATRLGVATEGADGPSARRCLCSRATRTMRSPSPPAMGAMAPKRSLAA